MKKRLLSQHTEPGLPDTVPTTYEQHCYSIDWPAPHLLITRVRKDKDYLGELSWMGSLLNEQRDASGQMYRRNRYYDPASGRFTQEDPIGIAGGLNVYGYANGDPVSYSDPYGLCPDPAKLAQTGLPPGLPCPGDLTMAVLDLLLDGRRSVMTIVNAGADWLSSKFGGSDELNHPGGPRSRPAARRRGGVFGYASNVPQHATQTVDHVRRTGQAPPGHVGGRIFQNREGRLPSTDANGNAIQYREWDVHPRIPGQNRGAERVVTGSDGKAYYTNDHYQTFTGM